MEPFIYTIFQEDLIATRHVDGRVRRAASNLALLLGTVIVMVGAAEVATHAA